MIADPLAGRRPAASRPNGARRRCSSSSHTLPWGTQVVFEYARDGDAQAALPTSARLAAAGHLFVGTDARMGLLDAGGYYDASMNGHRLFGWQVNRGLQRLPDFYRADQFYKKLERPDVMDGCCRPAACTRRSGWPRLTPPVAVERGRCRSRSPPRRGSRSCRPLPGRIVPRGVRPR